MTPAVKQLQQLDHPFQLHQYHHDKSCENYGAEAADKLAIDARQIFKTLVFATENNSLAVAIVPVNNQLSLKQAAKAIKAKKAVMADPKKVQVTTGYILGGVSPFGQKKPLPTIIDSSAQQFDTIFVSGGKRGLEIEISPAGLSQILNATCADIAEY